MLKLMNHKSYSILFIQSHSIHTLKGHNQSKHVVNIQKQGDQKKSMPLAQPLTQVEGPYSGERFPSLKRAPFA